MNKEELVARVAESTSQSKQVTKQVLEKFLEVVSENLADGNNIELRGFGSFKVKARKERVARNPRTGEKVTIPRRLVPTFKPSRQLTGTVSEE
jgi:DNA-binding protein HU-beta